MRFISLLCCVLAASVATAASAKDMKVATVDLARLFKDYPGTHAAQKKFAAIADQKKQDLTDEAQDLQDLKKELTTSASVLSPEQLRKKKDEYDKKQRAFLQSENQIQQDLADKESEMTQSVLSKIKKIVAAVAKNEGVDLVLDSDKTVYVRDGEDLTPDVLKAFKNVKDDSDND